MKIEAVPAMPEVLKISSSLKLDFSVLGLGSKLEMYQVDYTRPDLTLLRSEYVGTHNGDTKTIIAIASPDKLEIQTTAGERSTWKTRELAHSVYPSSALNILPAFRGLWPENSYRYPVYNAQTGSVAIVKQRVKSYERLERFDREAYRLATNLGGQRTQSWIDAAGNTLMETGKLGLFTMAFILENP